MIEIILNSTGRTAAQQGRIAAQLGRIHANPPIRWEESKSDRIVLRLSPDSGALTLSSGGEAITWPGAVAGALDRRLKRMVG